MALNIKTPEAHALATELAILTGESVSAAVTTAIRERLERERERPGAFAERLLAIGRACGERLSPPYDTVDHGELLYDDRGLPK